MKRIMVTALVAAIMLSAAFSLNCFVYFDGIGCPHCAKVDAYLFPEYVVSHNDTVVIEYEIYQTKSNVNVLTSYISKYGGINGVPQLFLGNGKSIAGDVPVLNFLKSYNGSSKCLTLNGAIDFNELNYSTLPGVPKIWYGDKVVIVGSYPLSNDIVKKFLFSNYTPEGVNVTPMVSYSGGSIRFKHAVKVEDWYFYWGREGQTNQVVVNPASNKEFKLKLNWVTVTGLAATDAINPCALAVLTLMLIAIMTYNPKNRYKVLLAGLAFSFTVFVMYFVYGILIVKAFQLVQSISDVRSYLVGALSIFAIILGLLQLKDYFHYKPGTPFTEMPLRLRPKAKALINKITSPIGAVFLGAFVTLFLLPCTIGPYFVAGGLLSELPLANVLPYLIYYNLIFISPMIGITLAVYFGLTTVKDVRSWKDKNIRLIHAIAGAIMVAIGIYLLWSVV